MKPMLKKIAAIILSTMLLTCILPAQRAEAASAFKSSDINYSLKKGKTTAFQSYIPKVGLRKHTVKLTEYSTQKGTAKDADGNVYHLTSVRATMIVTLPKLKQEEAKKIIKAGYDKKDINYWDVSFINLKNGKHATLWRPSDSTFDDILEYTPMHTRKVKLSNNTTYEYADKYRVSCYCLLQSADKVAMGIHGCKKISKTYNTKKTSWYAGKLSFNKTSWYSKNIKKTSAWNKIN